MNISINMAQVSANKSNSFFAGGAIGQNDKVAQSQQKTSYMVNNVMRKADNMESSFTTTIDKHKQNIAKSQKEMNEAYDVLTQSVDAKEKARLEAGVSEEDAALFDKQHAYENDPKHAPKLSKEEQEQLAALRENPAAARYEKDVALYTDAIEDNTKQIKESIQSIDADTSMINAVKLEHVKVNVFAAANREIDAVKDSANQELIGDLVDQMKDHVDEQLNPDKDEEKEGLVDSADISDEVEEAKEAHEKTEAAKAESSGNTTSSEGVNKTTKGSDSVNAAQESMDDIKNQVAEAEKKIKKLEEAMEGLNVDTFA